MIEASGRSLHLEDEVVEGDELILDETFDLSLGYFGPALVEVHHILHQQEGTLPHLLLALAVALLYDQPPLDHPRLRTLGHLRLVLAAEAVGRQVVAEVGLEEEGSVHVAVLHVVLNLPHRLHPQAENYLASDLQSNTNIQR